MKPTLTLLFIILLMSCDRSSDTKYLYTKPEAVVFDILSGEAQEMSTVSYADQLITVMMHAQTFTYTSNIDFSIITKAHASTKDRHTIAGLEKIKNIQIYTLNDYSANYPAGSEITDSCLFGLHGSQDDSSWYIPVVTDSLSKAKIITELNKLDKKGYDYYDYNTPKPISRFSFRINHPPTNTGKQQFAIRFETDTPSLFGDTTIAFILKP